MSTSIRRATTDDVPALGRLRWEWRAGEGRPLEMDEATFLSEFPRWLAAHADSHRGFVAVADDTVVGIAWLAIIERVPGPDQWVRRSGIVQSVYVAPAHRGAGAGQALVQALLDEAAAEKLHYVSVHPSQLSFPMYRRLGFRDYHGVLEIDITAHRIDRTP